MPDTEGFLPARPQPQTDSGTLPARDVTAVVIPASAESREPEQRAEPARAAGTSAAQSLEDRLAAVTSAGGLSALPADFGDAEGGWMTVRSDNPFTVLQLDYRKAQRISPELVARHRELLQRFWQEKLRSMSQGAARFAILKKYGGPEESERLVRSYPELIENAYQQLITRGGIDAAWRRIVAEKEAIVCRKIDEKLDDFLVDSVLQPEEVRALLVFAEREGVRAATVAERIHERLRVRGFVGDTQPAGVTLEAQLLSTAWVHPGRQPKSTAAAVVTPPRQKQSMLLPLLLFSVVVVLVLLAGAAIQSAGRENRVSMPATPSTTVEATLSSQSPEPAETPSTSGVMPEAAPEPKAIPAAERPAAATTTIAREAAPETPAVNAGERRRLREKLASIEQYAGSEPQEGLDRLAALEQTLGAQYVEERIAVAQLRAGLQRALLLQQMAVQQENEKKAAEERARAEREREWEQRLAAVEELMKQPNYSGAKTLADQLLASPDIPPAVAERATQLRDHSVAELQKIFSDATVKSRTGRAPRRRE